MREGETAEQQSGTDGGWSSSSRKHGQGARVLLPLWRLRRRLGGAGGVVSSAAHVGRLGISEYHGGCGGAGYFI